MSTATTSSIAPEAETLNLRYEVNLSLYLTCGAYSGPPTKETLFALARDLLTQIPKEAGADYVTSCRLMGVDNDDGQILGETLEA
jgi:hypothetical protein